MSGADVQRLYDMMTEVRDRLAVLETTVAAPVDISKLRWDFKAINYIIMRVVSPVLITVLLGGSAFYYGIHCQIGNLDAKISQHIDEKLR